LQRGKRFLRSGGISNRINSRLQLPIAFIPFESGLLEHFGVTNKVKM
jgi:hypothetical protein